MKMFRPATGSMRGLNWKGPKKPRSRLNRIAKSEVTRKIAPSVPRLFGIRLW